MNDSHFVTLLEWDSSFFNQNIGNVVNPLYVEMNELAPYDIVTCKVESQDFTGINKMSSLGFSFIESELNFSLCITNENFEEYDLESVQAKEENILELKSISGTSFQISRYREPWFSLEKNRELYETWVEKAVLGTFDDVCLISRTAGKISGFVTLKMNKNRCAIGLLAVKHEFRQQGIAKKLISLAKMFSAKQGCEFLTVATQGNNVLASNAYIKAGFTLNSTCYWFYKAKS